MKELLWIGFRPMCAREERCLGEKGLTITSASSLADALPGLYERPPDIVVLCLSAARTELARQIRQVRAAAGRVFVAVVVQCQADVLAALRAGADEALSLENSGDRICYPMLQWADGVGGDPGGVRLMARRNAYLEARVAELERENARLVSVAAVDEASGLVARSSFVQLLDRTTVTGSRSATGALLLVDLPGLGAHIDVFGGFVMGGVLQQIAASLRGCARAWDVVARIGPERFAILMPDTAEAVALEVLDRVSGVLGRLELPRRGRVCATLELCRLPVPGAAASDVLAACEARLPSGHAHASTAA